MIKYMVYTTLLVFTILLSLFPYTIDSHNVQEYNQTMSCSMYGINLNLIIGKNFTPSMPDPPIAPNTCQIQHPEYSDMACCNYNQSLVLQNSMVIGATIFGKCPACMFNVWDLWCASSCSPYQSTFMIVTETKNTTVGNVTYPQIKEAEFILDPVYAEGLYNSCRDISSSGSQPFGAMYKNYDAFFNQLFGSQNPAFKILFTFDADIGYTNDIVPCSESCSCDCCRDTCFTPTEFDGLNFNNSGTQTTDLFNHKVPVVSVWAGMAFYLFLVAFFGVLSLYFAVQLYRQTLHQAWIFGIVAILLVIVSGVIVPFVSGAAPANSSKTCTYKMPYDKTWDCGLAIFVFIYSPLAALSLIISTAYLFVKHRNLVNPPTAPGSMNGYSSITSVFGASSSPPSSPKFEGIGIKDPSMIQRLFYLYGQFVSRHPLKIVAFCLLFTVVCSIGILKLDIEQDPVKLWVSPTSRAAKEKDYFDENFGPFYRIEQLIITPKTGAVGNILNLDNLVALLDLELQLMNLTAQYEGQTLTLEDLCFQPTHMGCLVESVTGMWQRNMTTVLDSDADGGIENYYITCTGNILGASCMDAIGTPVNPNVVLGGWSNQSVNASTFVTTFLLNNPVVDLNKAMAWEKVWLAAVKEYADDPNTPFHIAYSAERSIQDELSREGSADIPTILISYIVMFLYVSLALGRFYPIPSRLSSIIVNSRFSLGLFGILVVAFSIAISVGICSVIGIKATLIISEVIPFLVLAIGVDNIFVLVNTFESLHVSSYNTQTRTTTHPRAEETLARAFAKVGPSMTLASVSESIAFLLGALTKMPAVVAFSYYASLAIFFDFLLQISAFSALLVIDTKRSESRRIDCFPCVSLEGDNSDDDEPVDERQPLFDNKLASNSTNSTYDISYKKKDGLLKLLFRKYYAPFLVHPFVKVGVIVFFVGLFFAGIACSFQLQYGLDQRVAIPKDSYLQDYFNEMDLYLEAGPPFYIVIRGDYNYTNIDAQNQLCALGGCSNTSIINIYNDAPYVLPGISSWMDDYIQFTQNPFCCLVDDNGNICAQGNLTCQECFTVEPNGRPNPDQFVEFLPAFLEHVNNYNCPLAGLGYQSDTRIVNGTIVASRFDGYHTTLRTQQDFINAMKSAYWVSDHSDLDMFPYSVFYVFFEQYLTIKEIAIMDICLALAGVLVVCLLLLSNPVIAMIVVVCVGMVSMDLLGVMALWSVNLNAVSVVNVVMAIGISIEFCVHIAHTFIRAPEGMSKDEKAKYAIAEVGSSIVSGIFITKLLGVVVLGFSNSEIFQVYYFRMYISIVFLGGAHGLVLLPVLLSIFGTDRYSFAKLFASRKVPEISL
eukprot:gene7495-8771_t